MTEKVLARESADILLPVKKECNIFKNSKSPDAASRRVVVQDSVTVEPLDDAVLHLHRYVTHDAQ